MRCVVRYQAKSEVRFKQFAFESLAGEGEGDLLNFFGAGHKVRTCDPPRVRRMLYR